jgi:hypothetical protein
MIMSENSGKLINQDEVDKNYEAFKLLLPELVRNYKGQYALMRKGELVQIYSSASDALNTGQKFYEDGLFSIQKITDEPEDLGFFSHAMFSRNI